MHLEDYSIYNVLPWSRLKHRQGSVLWNRSNTPDTSNYSQTNCCVKNTARNIHVASNRRQKWRRRTSLQLHSIPSTGQFQPRNWLSAAYASATSRNRRDASSFEASRFLSGWYFLGSNTNCCFFNAKMERKICSTSCFWVFLHAVREYTRTSRWLSVNIAAQVSTPVSDRPFLFLQLQNWVQSQGYWNDASDFSKPAQGQGLSASRQTSWHQPLLARATLRCSHNKPFVLWEHKLSQTTKASKASRNYITRARDRAYKQFMSCVRSSRTPSHHNQMLKQWFLPLKEARASWSSESLGNQN